MLAQSAHLYVRKAEEGTASMMKCSVFARFLVAVLAVIFGATANAAETLDTTSRTAVISAFEPEWIALQGMLQDRREYLVNGTSFTTGTIEGKPVVLFLSGISMVNAAMTTQVALDRFTIGRIVFSGIAGGVDPDFNIGDVVVPEAWSQYLEAVFAREKNGTYTLPSFADRSLANYGMIFPQPVEIANHLGKPEKRLWFPVDAQLLAIARSVSGATPLELCAAKNECLTHKPRIVVGATASPARPLSITRHFGSMHEGRLMPTFSTWRAPQ